MFERFLLELRGNARLRIAVALVFAVLWLYLILLMRDSLSASAREYRNASTKLSKLRSVVQQGDWAERLTAAKTLQAKMESELWRGDTLGLARASFQDWLNQQAQQAAVSRPVVSLATATEEKEIMSDQTQPGGVDGLWKVTAKMVFDFTPESFNKLLALMEGHTQHVAIESMHITKEPVARVEIMASAYFQKSDRSRSPDK